MAARDVPAPSKYERENHAMRQWMPIPDGTTLTIDHLRRELAALREILETRIHAMDKAVTLLQAQADKSPTIGEFIAKVEEQFQGTNLRFHERDLRFDRQALDTKQAVDAAFAAAALATSKTEAAFIKQIDQITELGAVNSKAESARIDDIRTRLTAIEGRAQAYSQGFTYIATAIGIVAAIVGAVVALFFNKTVGI